MIFAVLNVLETITRRCIRWTKSPTDEPRSSANTNGSGADTLPADFVQFAGHVSQTVHWVDCEDPKTLTSNVKAFLGSITFRWLLATSQNTIESDSVTVSTSGCPRTSVPSDFQWVVRVCRLFRNPVFFAQNASFQMQAWRIRCNPYKLSSPLQNVPR